MGPGESARLGVWILDGDPAHGSLLRFPFQQTAAAGLDRCLVLLCASMTQPWTLMDSLGRWARMVQEHLELSPDLPSSNLDRQAIAEGRERREFCFLFYDVIFVFISRLRSLNSRA